MPNRTTAILVARHAKRPDVDNETEYRFVTSGGQLIFSGYYTEAGIQQIRDASYLFLAARQCPHGSFGTVINNNRVIVWGNDITPQQLLVALGQISPAEATKSADENGVVSDLGVLELTALESLAYLRTIIERESHE